MSDKPLTLGMVGTNVAALHQALSKRGFTIAEAETQKQFFGPATRMAVGEFQKTHGIDPSCEVCMATAAKLGTTLAENAAANYNQPQGQVLTAQVGSAANDSQPQGQVEYLQVGTANYNQPQGQTFSSQVGTRQQPIQDGSKRKMPTHLSVFALAKSTGHPIARMPFYAEVGVVSVSALPQPKCNLQEAIRNGINEFIASTSNYSVSFNPANPAIRQLSDKLVEPLCDALYRLLAPAIVDQWVRDQVSAAGAIAEIIQIASDLAKARSMDWNNPQMLGQLLEEAILAYAKENKLPLAEANAQGARIVWAHPLGVLATDHVGYLSFDLTRLPQDVADAVALALEARRRNPTAPTETSIWLYPMAQEEGRIDALAQMRFAHDAIVVKLALDVELDPELCQPKLCESIKNLGIMAMQNPNLTDWRLSPGSFATNPGTLVGADGCETILPANVALQEYYFYQVVRLTNPEASISNTIKLGVVHEYRIAWHPLGHSLGQILYSMPLAPGETVNLAVIDWTRRDDARRKEDTTLDEELIHNEHRDRTISETVNAAVNEYQHGSSFMAGIAGSYGAAGGSGGTGAAAGIAGSLGGSTSSSSGSRNVVASTVQGLSDNISQTSTAKRELHSTVVVHSTQKEHEAIETRTVVNYNHSHTLTILYYEVLRHFRVATELVRRRPAVLVKLKTDWFDTPAESEKPQKLIALAQNILEHRAVLESALLDTKYAEGFNAIERLSHRFDPFESPPVDPQITPLTDFTKKLPRPTIPWPYNAGQSVPAGPELRFFMFEITSGSWTIDPDKGVADHNITIEAVLWPVNIQLQGGYQDQRLSPNGAFAFGGQTNTFVGVLPADKNSVHWGEIDMIAIKVHLQKSNASFAHIKVTAIDVNGNKLDPLLVDQVYDNGTLNLIADDWTIKLPTRRPAPVFVPTIPYYDVAAAADHAKGFELVAHLQKHKRYYSRAIILNQNSVERAFDLDDMVIPGGSRALEHLDNRPLEIIGDYVAYPCTDPDWNLKIKPSLEPQPGDAELHLDERLITLPTRGVFAEAKLGHCNASEEIDPNRFWDWQQSPIPHSAPEIAAIEAGKHTVNNPNLQSTPFPQPIVNIVNPPNAPDPTGLASAMNVLATSNIFRDMSGRAEVADLLKKLSDNSVAIAGVAQQAATAGVGGSSSTPSGGGGSVSRPPSATNVSTDTGQSSPPPATSGQNQSSAPPQRTPEEIEKQNLENQDTKLSMAQKLPPPQKKEVQKAVTKELKKPSTVTPSLGFLITFQRAGYGNPGSGSAIIEIRPFGKRKYGSDYEQGVTTGPPTSEQQTTIPEKYEANIVDGIIMFKTDHASAPGTVTIKAKYNRDPDPILTVIASSQIYDAKSNTLTYTGTRDYSQPTSGDIVVLDVTPKYSTKKVIAKTAQNVVNELGTEAGGELIITAKATGKYGKTTSGEQGEEFEVFLLGGGLDIKQKNGAKDS